VRYLGQIICWSLAAVTIFVLACSISESPSFKECVAERVEQSRQQQKEEISANLRFVAARNAFRINAFCVGQWVEQNNAAIGAAATALIAILTVVLAVVAGGQIRQTKILERAHLSVEPLGIHCRKGGPWFATVGIKNSGRLPARNMRWFIGIERFSDDDAWKDLPEVGEMRRGPDVPPGATVRRSGKHFHVDQRYYRQPDQPERFMYVWGVVRYKDGFGRRRFTKFCHRYNSKAIEEAMDGSACIRPEDGRYHDDGNGAT
jgi:hypothetical protein